MDKLWRRVGLLTTSKKHYQQQAHRAADELQEKQHDNAKPQQTDGTVGGVRAPLSELAPSKLIPSNSFDKKRTKKHEFGVDEAQEGDDDDEDDHDRDSRLNQSPKGTQNNGSEAASPSQRPPAQPAPTAFYDCLTPMTRNRLNTLAQIGEDWLYLALLGIIMALLSLFMDSMITMFLGTRIWLSEEMSEQNLVLEYLAWCLVPILLVTFSTGFVHLCSPTAIGSGIPEMKTILRGVVLNEYLTFRTLVAKIVGLTFTLGSGLPLGKEGPSVHMASIVATLLSKLVASFQGIYENESRTSEMLSAACAVGVAATFYAPIGGVLFSIEVTTVYFAIRNYWRGFFAACCGATIWRLLGFYIQNDESISAIFKTNFSTDYPFDPVELLLFSFIGATCGLAGAAYIKFHREIVQFFRRHKRVSGFLQQNRFVYPTLVTLIITTSTFPPLLGQYTAATLSTHTTIEHLFSNRTWSLGSQDLVSKRILDSWTTESTGFHLHLVLYILMLFWTSALASTIPTPSGVFIPVVKMGAAYGRLIGELVHAAYPTGVKYSQSATIVPGSYAVVGAAAFSGAVTHTVSTSVILFEMTGQIVHIIPVILGVLISNAVCQSLQPSIYDSIIEIKKLPYLPPIASSNSISHRILVKDFMNKKNIPFIWKERCTYADLKALLSNHCKIISFPLVESPASMKLLGSVARPDLLKLLYMHLGRERRLQEVCRRNSDTLTPAIQMLSTISKPGGQPLPGLSLPSNSPAKTTTSDDAHEEAECKPARPKPPCDLPLDANQTTSTFQLAKKMSADSTSSSDDKGLEFNVANNEVSGAQQQQIVTDSSEQRLNKQPTKTLQQVPRIPGPNSEQRNNASGSNLIVLIDDGLGSTNDDSTRLIISASQKCHKYGATVSTRNLAGHAEKRPEVLALDRSGSKQTTTPVATTKQRPGQVGQPKFAKDSSQSDVNKTPKFGEEQLLSDCQKRENAYEEALKEFGGVAKFINHYDRGSTMDKDHLERSMQEVEGHLAKVHRTPPEIVIVVEPVPPDDDGCSKQDAPNGHSKLGANSKRPLYRFESQQHQDQLLSSSGLASNRKLTLLQPPSESPNKLQARASYQAHSRKTGDSSSAVARSKSHQQLQVQPPTSDRLPRRQLTPAPSPNLYHHPRNHHKRYHHYSHDHQPVSHSVSSSPSLSSRPTKSILKTSSCNSMAKRSMSNSQSFLINSNNSSQANINGNNNHSNKFNQQQQQQHVHLQNTTTDHLAKDELRDNMNNARLAHNRVATTPNHLSNLKFKPAPDLQPHKPGLSFDLEAGSGLQNGLARDNYQDQQQQQIRQRRKVRLPRLRVVDMTPEEQEQWEKEQLSAHIDLNRCQIDEAPFQLVEQTSLYRVHTLFSMLGLNHAYVTSFGRLVGIVALKDIRYAIEKMLQEKV